MRLLLAVLATLVVPAISFAHGNEPVLPDAVEALQNGQIFVDYDARPTLTELEADALGRRLAQKPGVYIAVLSASTSDEAGTSPDGIAAALAKQVDHKGVFLVAVGGRTGAWAPAANTFYEIHGGSLAEQLTFMVDRVHTFSAPSSGRSWWWLVAPVAGAVGAIGFAAALWRRRASSRP